MLSTVYGQAPKMYIHIVSHNEPSDNLQSTLNYAVAKQNALQMAQIIDSKDVKWNLQTSDGFVLGALADQSSNNSNIFKTLALSPYSDNIEIDPRSKNTNGRNIADQWYLLDSLNANPSHHLGGCIYSTTDAQVQAIDWEQYRNPIIGNVYGNSWQCSMITGAGSYPPHTNDLHDFGIFKPDSPDNFYQNNPSQNLWCMGTGCAPVLDSLDDEQAIIDLIKGQVDSIQSGFWPQDKFYVTRIMTNQREYGPMFFEKISKVIDSLNLIPSTQLQWATMSEAFNAFEQWRTDTQQDYSQWLCGETLGLAEQEMSLFEMYPNPVSSTVMLKSFDGEEHTVFVSNVEGSKLYERKIKGEETLSFEEYSPGIYFVNFDGFTIKKLIKE